MAFNLVADGTWAFTDSEASELAVKVLKAHRDLFGSMPSKQSTLILLPFQGLLADRWSAETRGSTVTLLMGQVPSKVAALVRLSTPLTHELFHLWVPNGLALNNDYDWFYEGFTIYQAARTAVRLDLLTWPEFSNAIARAYDGYVAGVDHDRWSLIEASQRRWTVGESSVYSKSMVIAFLYDLKLRSASHGKRSLNDVYHRIFQWYRLSDPDSSTLTNERDGNDAVMNVLAGESMSQDFVQTFIRNPVAINLQAELAPFGLRAERLGLRTGISVGEQLPKRQRDLLRELGYNDYVRHQRRGT
jgi:predicted metalloprotease with PDZ domain